MGNLDDLIAAESRDLLPPDGTAIHNRAVIDNALANGWQVPAHLARDLSAASGASAWTLTSKLLVALACVGVASAAVVGVVEFDNDDDLHDAPDVAEAPTHPSDNASDRPGPTGPRSSADRGQPVVPTAAPISHKSSAPVPHAAQPGTHNAPLDHEPPSAETKPTQGTPNPSKLAEATRPDAGARDSLRNSRLTEPTTDARRDRPRSAARPRSKPSTTGQPDKQPSDPKTARTYHNELTLLEQAKHLLDVGSTRRARRVLRRHASQFPRGTFAAERDAMLVVCECGLADSSEQRRRIAARYDAEHSNSPFGPRIRRACGTSEAP